METIERIRLLEGLGGHTGYVWRVSSGGFCRALTPATPRNISVLVRVFVMKARSHAGLLGGGPSVGEVRRGGTLAETAAALVLVQRRLPELRKHRLPWRR